MAFLTNMSTVPNCGILFGRARSIQLRSLLTRNVCYWRISQK
jgi:hypothetical protein